MNVKMNYPQIYDNTVPQVSTHTDSPKDGQKYMCNYLTVCHNKLMAILGEKRKGKEKL